MWLAGRHRPARFLSVPSLPVCLVVRVRVIGGGVGSVEAHPLGRRWCTLCMCPTPSIREKLKESTQTHTARQPGQRRAQTRGWIESIKGRSIETPWPQTQCKCRARRLGTIQRGCVESRCGGGGLMADGDDEGAAGGVLIPLHNTLDSIDSALAICFVGGCSRACIAL